jgi:mRNA-degrading endonuclease RelE of RelBE toxin-antitoxin system
MVDKLVKFLRKQNPEIARSILELIEKILVGDLRGCDVRRLKGKSNLYRLRKGRIRIIFEKKEGKFLVKKITYRDDQTYQDL